MVQLALSAIAVVFDLAWLVSSAVIVWTLASGGGQYTVAGHVVRMRSVMNPLIAWQAIALLRLSLLRGVPFLAVGRWSIEGLESGAWSWCLRASTFLSSVVSGRAQRVIFGFGVVITLAKLANAAAYPGFFSGDDVEIHEMTFATLFALDWSAWDLRSAFYPMTFIYPVQALLVRTGITDTSTLVLAGRVVVALVSSIAIWLVYRIGAELESPGVGVVAAVMFGVHRLHVTFGGSELPRPVATVFIVAAFLCLLSRQRSLARTAIAGVLLTVGGALRFGELVFIVPALVTTLGLVPSSVEGPRDYRSAVVLVMSFVITAIVILGVADFWYWGSPFYSAHRIVQYTLIDRLSSRGYEPPWFYITALMTWTSLPIALLAMLGARRSWQVTVWWLLPLIALSLLPHKEPRYVIALLPFVCLSAALGLRRLLHLIAEHPLTWRPATAAAVTVVLCAGGVLLEVGGWRFRKPSEPIALAQFVSQRGCSGGVAVEQRWNVGGRLYLRNCGQVIDLDRASLQRSIGSTEWILLKGPLREDERALLEGARMRRVDAPNDSYAMMRRSP